MYIVDGICYADDSTPVLTVSEITALDGYKLKVMFSTGVEKTVDFSPMLSYAAFIPLRDEAVFRDIKIDHGVPVWLDGEIDIAPEALYSTGT